MEYKSLSFAERRQNPACNKVEMVSLCPATVKVNKRTKGVDNGRIVYRSQVVAEDPRSNFEGVTIYDFDIDMMRDAGTLAMAKIGSLQGSSFGNVDGLVGTLSSIDDIEE